MNKESLLGMWVADKSYVMNGCGVKEGAVVKVVSVGHDTLIYEIGGTCILSSAGRKSFLESFGRQGGENERTQERNVER